jgi:hypothetical protein
MVADRERAFRHAGGRLVSRDFLGQRVSTRLLMAFGWYTSAEQQGRHRGGTSPDHAYL